MAVTANLLEVLLLTARLSRQEYREEPVRLADHTAQAVLDTVSHLETHFHQPVRLAVLAERVHLSPGHLSRAFSRRMGMGPVQFVAHLRGEEACRLLRNGRSGEDHRRPRGVQRDRVFFAAIPSTNWPAAQRVPPLKAGDGVGEGLRSQADDYDIIYHSLFDYALPVT